MPLLERTPPRRIYALPTSDDPAPATHTALHTPAQQSPTPAPAPLGISSPASRLASRLAASQPALLPTSTPASTLAPTTQPSHFLGPNASPVSTFHSSQPAPSAGDEHSVPHPFASTSPARPHQGPLQQQQQQQQQQQPLRRSTSSGTLGAVLGAAVTAIRRSTGIMAPPSPLPMPSDGEAVAPDNLSSDTGARHANDIARLQHALDSLRLELAAAKVGEQRAREEAEGWAAECDALQQEQQQQHHSSAASAPRPSTRPSMGPGAVALQQHQKLQQQQIRQHELALRQASIEIKVARVSVEYTTLLNISAHHADACARVTAQFEAMRARYALKRAQRELEAAQDAHEQALDHDRRSWIRERGQLKQQLSENQQALQDGRQAWSEEKAQLQDQVQELKKKAKSNDCQVLASKSARPQARAAVPGKTGNRNGRTDFYVDDDDGKENAPPPSKAQTVKATKSKVKPVAAPSPGVSDDEEIGDESDFGRFDDYEPHAKPKAKTSKISDRKPEPQLKGKPSGTSAQKTTSVNPATKRKVVDQDDGAEVEAVLAPSGPKKPKKQRLLGGATGAAGGVGVGKGLSFLTGAGAGGVAGVAGATTVSAIRKQYASEEASSLNPSAELGLPLTLSPLKPGTSTARKGGIMPSFLSRAF